MAEKEQETTKEADKETKEEISEAYKDFVVRTVNAAVSTHMTKSMPKQIQGALEKAMAPISEQLAALALPPDEKKQEKQEKPTEMKAYEAKLAELNGKLEEERKARDDERTTRLRNEERSKAATILREAGLSEGKVKAALAVLHTEEKRIARAEDGSIIFKIPRKGYEESVEVAEGLREWLKTDEGKEFAPARSAAGSGAKGGNAPEGGKNGKPTRDELMAQLSNQILNGQER